MRVLVLGVTLTLLALPSAALPVNDLQRILDASNPGALVVVPKGVYDGELVIRKAVRLRAESGAILRHRPGQPGPTLWVQAAGATVEGLVLEGTGVGERPDRTALVVTAPDVVIRNLAIRNVWCGVWGQGADNLILEGLSIDGLRAVPYWERGDGIRLESCTSPRLDRLVLAHVADGLYLQSCKGSRLENVRVTDARYGVHLMFCLDGHGTTLETHDTVVGLMAMETKVWSISRARFEDGQRVGSAGVRLVRTLQIRVSTAQISRQATGVELLDAQETLFQDSDLSSCSTGWALGGRNTGSRVEGINHRGNVVDVSGTEFRLPAELSSESHADMAMTISPASPSPIAVRFQGNYWDMWQGLDLNGDGWGDTPFRTDRNRAAWSATRPWTAIFLGSPWSILSQGLSAGEVLDPWPRVRPHEILTHP